ncbi:MerR family transcriptional regulator [Clostridiaceae bacterium M8S5]|nr:MerR family transcriptional regulator [Clostridiaceae bacterium M8S5]
MYSIGQFSIITKLSKKTLRYYDDIGLLKPAYINPTNQYRYYNKEQVKTVKEIIKLKAINISLEKIKEVLSKNDANILEIYNDRLNEIRTSLRELEKQKEITNKYINELQSDTLDIVKLEITKGYYIERGKIVYQTYSRNEDINFAIGEFYSYINSRIGLLSRHMFRFDINNDDSFDIFAYTEDKNNNLNIRRQEKEICLKITCDIKDRENGYQMLFDYTRQNNIEIKYIYEAYVMNGGKMSIDIMFGIK